MLYSINLTFTLLLFFSTMIVISSPSWFCMWIGIEMNTMAFIPLMYRLDNKLPTESALSYFLVQTFASMIMFLSIISLLISDFYNLWMTSNMMLLSMGIKLGAAPFHMWYPSVVEGLSWLQNMVLMTWQKIAPLTIMSIMQPTTMNLILSVSSMTMGSISAINQTSLRKIMAYSSITHMSWIIVSMFSKTIMWLNYMLIYFTTTIFTILSMWLTSSNYISQISSKSVKYMPLLMITLLSMGGFPPMLGFVGSWLVLNELVFNKMILMSMMLVASSCLNLYVYLRILHPIFHMKSVSPKININMDYPYMTYPLILVSTLTSPFMLLL